MNVGKNGYGLDEIFEINCQSFIESKCPMDKAKLSLGLGRPPIVVTNFEGKSISRFLDFIRVAVELKLIVKQKSIRHIGRDQFINFVKLAHAFLFVKLHPRIIDQLIDRQIFVGYKV